MSVLPHAPTRYKTAALQSDIGSPLVCGSHFLATGTVTEIKVVFSIYFSRIPYFTTNLFVAYFNHLHIYKSQNMETIPEG
jgi:hypothetical protein